MVTIVIDAGHGGTANTPKSEGTVSSWNNATGPNGLREKDATLALGIAVAAAFADKPLRVILTRSRDENLSLDRRAEVARSNRADVFVSIHFNAPQSCAAPAQGTETWTHERANDSSRRLARAVQSAVQAATGYRDRGVKASALGVLNPSKHYSGTACCLVEVSFLSCQAEEEARLHDETYIARLADALKGGIIDYCRDKGLLTATEAEAARAETEYEDAAALAGAAMAGKPGEGAEAAFGLPAAADLRLRMSKTILDFEARRDSKGRLVVYALPKVDGGGSYEVAGINERYNPTEAAALRHLLEIGKYEEAERRACEYIATTTDEAKSWCTDPGVEFFLRDSLFNRGRKGAITILQYALGQRAEGTLRQATRVALKEAEADAPTLLRRLREAREQYEEKHIGRREQLWKGLINRWNKALAAALDFHRGLTAGPEAAAAGWPEPEEGEPFEDRATMLQAGLAGRPPSKRAIAGEERNLNAVPDVPDSRDKMYSPSLINLESRLPPRLPLDILDQGQEGACTGFALAAAINSLNAQRLNMEGTIRLPAQVSPRMLYEMAKLHDEWLGEDYSGSSLRGAMKGFFHNGACSLALAPYHASQTNWTLTIDQAKDARKVGLGSYYRVRPDATHYHAALNEVGVICVSARVHEGWRKPKNGRIEMSRDYIGGHAFIVVGYDETGFLVQNSWGPTWGGGNGVPEGTAIWSYADWAENVLDAWVLRLSVPTPEAFDTIRSKRSFELAANNAAKIKVSEPPRRQEVVGHIININDGELQEAGTYATPLSSLLETADLIASSTDGEAPYPHVMFYAHGGLNNLDDGARRAAALIEPLKRNGVYPIFFLWGTDVPDELWDSLKRSFGQATDRVGGFTDYTDTLIEGMVGKLGRAVWREIKRDAEKSFLSEQTLNGLSVLKPFLKRLQQRSDGGPKLHLVGHSAGSLLLGHMLTAMRLEDLGQTVASAHLMAPACSLDFYREHYLPALDSTTHNKVQSLSIYNLTDQREQADNVLEVYRKSLLYLVSNAFEEGTRRRNVGVPLLGMENFSRTLPAHEQVHFAYAGSDLSITDSKSHGGFDNDLVTMSTILARILGRAPDRQNALRPTDVEGY